jgi:hypothetical protein
VRVASPGPAAPLNRAPGLARPGGALVGRQDAVELAAGADAKLGKDLAQVVLDSTRADEQPGADFGVGQAITGQPGDLGFLRGQVDRGLTVRLPAVSPVATSSRRPRSANASVPIASSSFAAVYFLVTGIEGMSLIGIQVFVQDLVYGAALIMAVSVSMLTRRRTSAS